MTGTSPRFPSAITSSPAARAASAVCSERLPAGCAEPLEAGELQLHRDAGRPRPSISSPQAASTALAAAPRARRPGPWRREPRRVGVEAEADLALALVDERRQAVREWGLGFSRP